MAHSFKAGALLGLLVPLIFPATEVTAGGYRITDLGMGIIPAAINHNGDVTGTVVSPFSNPQAFLRRNGVVTRLGMLGGSGSWGLAINDAAEVVGSICLEEKCLMNPHWGLRRHAFIMSRGEVTDLNPTTGLIEATKINNSSVILGEIDPRTLPQHCRGKIVLYDHSKGSVTASVMTCGEETRNIQGTALNDRGEATVVKSECGTWLCAESYLYSSGNLLPLPGNGWVSWGATAMNDKTQVAGRFQSRKGDPFLTLARDTPRLRFLPTAINNGGAMVGCAVDTSPLEKKTTPKPSWMSSKLDGERPLIEACIPATFTSGRATPLQEQIAAEGDDWKLEGVFDLNDNGEIIGYGTKNGQHLHGFILSPQ